MSVDVPNQPAPPVSAHFVNNVLAAAASYIDEDPDYARDGLAELGQYLSYRLRESTAPVSAAQELEHTATYLRLQQARFPDRLEVEMPEAADVRGRVAPGTIREPVAELVGRRLREDPGELAVTLRAQDEGKAVHVAVRGAGRAESVSIPLTEVTA